MSRLVTREVAGNDALHGDEGIVGKEKGQISMGMHGMRPIRGKIIILIYIFPLLLLFSLTNVQFVSGLWRSVGRRLLLTCTRITRWSVSVTNKKVLVNQLGATHHVSLVSGSCYCCDE